MNNKQKLAVGILVGAACVLVFLLVRYEIVREAFVATCGLFGFISLALIIAVVLAWAGETVIEMLKEEKE